MDRQIPTNPHMQVLFSTYRDLKAALRNKEASPQMQVARRVAFRHVKAVLESQLDMLARLQYIEGVLGRPYEWSRRGNPAQGLKQAAKAIEAEYPFADMAALTSGKGWLSPRNTGFFSYVMQPIDGMLAEHPYADYEDVAQQMVMGAKRKMGWASLFHYAGNNDQKAIAPILEGSSTPQNRSLIARLRRWAIQSAGKFLREMERSQQAEDVSGLVMDDSDESVWSTAMPSATRSEITTDMVLFPDKHVKDDAEKMLSHIVSLVKERNLINGLIMQAFLEVARASDPSPSGRFMDQVASRTMAIINERLPIVLRVLRNSGSRGQAMADRLEAGESAIDRRFIDARMQTIRKWISSQGIDSIMESAPGDVQEAWKSFLRKQEAYSRQRIRASVGGGRVLSAFRTSRRRVRKASEHEKKFKRILGEILSASRISFQRIDVLYDTIMITGIPKQEDANRVVGMLQRKMSILEDVRALESWKRNGWTVRATIPMGRMASSDVPDDAQSFMDDIRSTVQKHFPRGYMVVRNDRDGAIHLATAVLPKGAQENGILHNDPAYQQFWIWNAFTPEGLRPKLKIDLSMGGRFGPDPFSMKKIGWRKKTGTPAQILKHIDRYFGKLRAMVDAEPGVDA